MAEGASGSSPEIMYVARAEAVGPMDRVKNRIADFVKSQRPSEHQRRTMEKFDWVGEHLDGTSKELLEKLRPTAEKAAKLAGVATSTMQIALALEVAAGTVLLVGAKGKDIFFNKPLREKTVGGVKDIAGKVKKEASSILKGTYEKAKDGFITALGVLGAGMAMKGIDKYAKQERGKPVDHPEQRATPFEKQHALARKIGELDSLASVRLEGEIPRNYQVGQYDSRDGREHFSVHVTHHGINKKIEIVYLDANTRETGEISMEVGLREKSQTLAVNYEHKNRLDPGQLKTLEGYWENDVPDGITSKTYRLLGQSKQESVTPQDYDRFSEFFDSNPVLNSTRTRAWAESIRNPHV